MKRLNKKKLRQRKKEITIICDEKQKKKQFNRLDIRMTTETVN